MYSDMCDFCGIGQWQTLKESLSTVGLWKTTLEAHNILKFCFWKETKHEHTSDVWSLYVEYLYALGLFYFPLMG